MLLSRHLRGRSRYSERGAGRDDEQKILRWEPESIVSLSQGIKTLQFFIPGSQEVTHANVVGLRDFEITLRSKHGVMARSDLSVTRAVDRIEYAETGAKCEYMDLAAVARRGLVARGDQCRHQRVRHRLDLGLES